MDIKDQVHFRFNAGSWIIENNFRGYFLIFLALAGGSNPAGPDPYPAGKS